MLSDTWPTSNLAAPVTLAGIYAPFVCMLESFIDQLGCTQVDCFVQNTCVYLAHAVDKLCVCLPCFLKAAMMDIFCLAQMTNCRWGVWCHRYVLTNHQLLPFYLQYWQIYANIVQLYRQYVLTHVCPFSSGSLCVCVPLFSPMPLQLCQKLVLVMKWQIQVAYAWFQLTTIIL